MAHFAQLNDKNIVTTVIVVDDTDLMDSNGVESEGIGIGYLQKLYGATTNWKQTSYNNNFRGNFAGIGFTFMTNVATSGLASTDVFLSQQPYPSWSLGVTTCSWIPPIPRPGISSTAAIDGYFYQWDEAAYQADTGSPKTVGWALTQCS